MEVLRKISKKLVASLTALLVTLAGVVSLTPAFSADTADSEEFFSVSHAGVLSLTEAGRQHFTEDHSLEVPQSVGGVTVTEIGQSTFKNMGLESVVLPDTVTTVNPYAFYGNSISSFSANGVLVWGDHSLQDNRIEDISLNSTVSVGNSAFRGNSISSLSLPKISSIAENAFRDNKISDVSFGSTLTTVRGNAFTANVLTSVDLPDGVTFIGDAAFSYNNISSAKAPSTVSTWGNDVFAGNNRYVRIDTVSSAIQTEYYSSGFGQVVNPITIVVKYQTEDGKDLRTPETLGEDLTKNAYSAGTEVTLHALDFEGYTPVEDTMTVIPNSDGQEFVFVYREGVDKPVITVDDTKNLVFKVGASVDSNTLLEKVSAVDADGNDVTSSLRVSPDSLDTSVPGRPKVIYTVEDSQGRSSTKTLLFSVVKDYSKLALGNGWTVADFVYEGNRVIGLSDSGLAKRDGGNIDLVLPWVNPDGEPVTTVGAGLDYNFKAYDIVAYDRYVKYAMNDQMRQKYASLAGVAVDDVRGIATYMRNNFSSINMVDEELADTSHTPFLDRLGFRGFESIKVPESVTVFDTEAFSRSSLLKTLNYPRNLRVIGSKAFADDTSFSNLGIPDTVESIGTNTFVKTNLSGATFVTPKSLKNIGFGAFDSSKLSGVKFTHPLTYVGAYSFARNNLTSVVIPEMNASAFLYGVFTGNRQLSSAVVPDSWNIIPERMFENTALTSFKFPSSLVEVGPGAFSGAKLTEINLPDTVTTIGKNAFRENSLTSLRLPESLKTIGASAFLRNSIGVLDLSGFSTLDIQDNAFQYNKISRIAWNSDSSGVTIGSYAFSGNSLAKTLDLPDSLPVAGTYAFSKNQINYVHIPSGWDNVPDGMFAENNLKDVVVPDNVRTLGIASFQINPDLVTLDLGNVVTIKDSAFYNTKLSHENITWSPDLETIGNNAFAATKFMGVFDMSGMTRLKSIGSKAFKPNAMTKIVLPPSLETLGDSAFAAKTIDEVVGLDGVQVTGTPFLGNPLTTVYFVDPDGNEISHYQTVYSGDNRNGVDYTPPSIPGYSRDYTPIHIDFNSSDDIRLTYVPISVVDANRVSLSVEVSQNDMTPSDRIFRVTVDNTGSQSRVIPEGTKVYVPLSNPYARLLFKRTSGADRFFASSEVKGDLLVLTFHEIQPGETTSVAVVVSPDKPRYADGEKIFVKAYMDDPDSNDESRYLAVSHLDDSDYLTYRQPGPYINKSPISVNTPQRNSEYTDFDNISSSVLGVSDSGKNYIDWFVLTASQREQSKNIITDSPQQYLTVNGTWADPVFVPEENPGWTKQGKTFVYVSEGHFKSSATGDLIGQSESQQGVFVRLRLHYPLAQIDSNINNTAQYSFVAYNPSPTEKVYRSLSSTASVYFHSALNGDVIGKYARGPYYNRAAGSYYVIDSNVSRKLDQTWLVSVNPINPVVSITDSNLDRRLEYRSVQPQSSSLFGAVVNAYDSDGAVIFSDILGSSVSEKTVIPERVRKDVSKIEVTPRSAVTSKTELKVYTGVRDPDTPLWEEYSTNTLGNSASVQDSTGRSFYAHEIMGIVPSGGTIQASKQSQEESIAPNTENTYTLGFTPSYDFSADVPGFKLVDPVPDDLEILDYSMSSEFSSISGAKVELVSDYNGTGRSALVFTAPNVPADLMYPGKTFDVGSLRVRYSPFLQEEYFTNKVFLQSSSPEIHYTEETVVENPEEMGQGSGTWSVAQSTLPFPYTKTLSTQVSIRHASPAGAWQSSISTYAGEKLDYRLKVGNLTDLPRRNPVVYDVLPYQGDWSVAGDSRGSKFSNTWDTSRRATVPEGWTIQYYNSDDPLPAQTSDTAKDFMESLSWSNEPSENTRAVRFSGPDSLPANYVFEAVLPMKAPEDHVEGLTKFAPDSLVGSKAFNTLMYSDESSSLVLEPVAVDNTISNPSTNINMRKVASYPSNKPLQGARFSLNKPDGTSVAQAVSDAEGNVRFTDVRPAPGYTVTEVEAPEGYQVTQDVVTLSEDDFSEESWNARTRSYTISKGTVVDPKIWYPIDPIYGNVRFTKVDVDGDPLQGVKFSLIGQSYNAGKTITTTSNAAGVVWFKNVPSGSWILRETGAPANFQPGPDIPVTIRTTGETVTPGFDGSHANLSGTYMNTLARVRLYKIGVPYGQEDRGLGEYDFSDGSPVSGASFDLYDAESSTKISTVNVSQDGAWLSSLKFNHLYRIVETVRPSSGFTDRMTTDYTFQILKDGTIADSNGDPVRAQDKIVAPNEKLPSVKELRIHKVNDAGESLSGAVFDLYLVDGDTKTLVGSTTVEQGYGTFGNVNEGSYEIVERQAPAGYRASREPISVVLSSSSDQIVTVDSVNKPYTVKILKQEVLASGLTEDQANDFVSGLGDSDSFVSQEDSGRYQVTRPLKDVEFDVKDSHDNLIEHVKTDDQGFALLKQSYSESETYKAVETAVPEGFVMPDNPVTSFRLSDYTSQNGFDGEITLKIFNSSSLGRVIVGKTDAYTGVSLSGAKFRIDPVRSTSDSFVSKTVTTDDNGMAVFDSIPAGSYTVTEVEAPDGYNIDTEPRQVVLTAGEVMSTTVSFKDTPKQIGFSFNKVDNQGHAVSGTHFTLKKVCAENQPSCEVTTQNLVSDGKGHVSVDAVDVGGTYQLVETQTAKGFMLLSKPITIHVSENGVTAGSSQKGVVFDADDGDDSFTVVNYKSGQLPLTGSPLSDRMPWAVVVTLLLTSALITAVAARRSRKRKI